jgi:hypothetical protein
MVNLSKNILTSDEQCSIRCVPPDVASLLAGNLIHRSRLGGFRIKKTKISRTISSLMNKSTLQRSLFFLAIFACIQLPIAAMGQLIAR